MEQIVDMDLKSRLDLAKDLWKQKNYIRLLEVVTENVILAQHLAIFPDYIQNLSLQAAAYHEMQYYQISHEKYESILLKSAEVIEHFGSEYLNKIKYYAALNKADLGDLNGAYKLLTAILSESTNEGLKVNTLVALGNVFQSLYQISRNEEYLDVAIQFLEAKMQEGTLDENILEYYQTTLGILWLQKGEIERAQTLLFHVVQTTHSDYLASHATDELALLYVKLRQFKQAEEYLIKANELLSETDDQVEMARNFFIWGLWFKEQHLYERAEHFLNESAKILEEKDVLIELVNVSYELFKLHEKVNPAKAAKFFVTCERVKKKIYFPEGV